MERILADERYQAYVEGLFVTACMSTYMAANLALIQPTGYPIIDYAQVYENMRGVPGEFPDMPAWEDTPVPQLGLQ